MTRQTFATLIFLAAVPFAASAETDMSTQFKQLDKNNDGQISQSEAKASPDLSKRFSAVDTNHDKQISVSEWQTDQQQRGAAGVSGETRDTQKSGSEMNKSY